MQKQQMHRSITERMFGYSRLTWKKLAIVPDAERKPLRERQPKPQRGRNLSQNERRRKNALPLEPNFNSSDLEMYRTRKWPYTHPEKGGQLAVQKKKTRGETQRGASSGKSAIWRQASPLFAPHYLAIRVKQS